MRMLGHRSAMLSIVLALSALCGQMHAQTAIPRTQGTTLAGAQIALPDALEGKPCVLVIGFSHASQSQVAEWGRRLSADFATSHRVSFFEIPMLAGAPKMLRGMIIKSMDENVPAAEKPHFLPLTDNEQAWRAVAHYNKPDDAYVLLLDGTGTVRGQTEGAATDAAYSDMKTRLEEVAQGKGTE